MRISFRVLPIVALLVACSVERVSTSSSAIQGGETSIDEPAIGILDMPGGNYCTGTLIAPDVVLTAGHCIVGRPIAFGTSTDSPTGSTKHAVAALAAHPSYAAHSCPNPTNDVGLVRLAAPVTDIAPIAWDGAAAVGDTCRAIGYGQHDEDDGEVTRKVKHEAENVVASSDGSHLVATWGTGIADHGDSGGPLLCGGKIVAVVSCHNDGDGPSHRTEVYEDLARDQDWIRAKLAEWAATPIVTDGGAPTL